MKHPIVTDRIQTFIAKNGFLRLLFLYLLFTLIFSVIIALIWDWLSLQSFDMEAHIYRVWYSFVFLYGYQPNLEVGFEDGSKLIAVLLSVGSVILPTVLLGAFVFKILLPKKARVIFRDRATVFIDENRGSFIAIHCYLGSRLHYVDWVFKAYLRAYVENKKTEFPLKTYPINLVKTDVPLPYTLMPTRILIPFTTNSKDSSPDHNPGIVLEQVGDHYQLVRVGYEDLSQYEIVDYEIIVLTSGKMPELGTDFIESKTYHASDIDFSEQFEIETTFDMRNEKGTVRGWDRF